MEICKQCGGIWGICDCADAMIAATPKSLAVGAGQLDPLDGRQQCEHFYGTHTDRQCGAVKAAAENASQRPEVGSTDGMDANRLEYILSHQHRVAGSGAFYFDGIRNGETLSREVIDRAMASIVGDQR